MKTPPISLTRRARLALTLLLALALMAPLGRSNQVDAAPALLASEQTGCGYVSKVNDLLQQTTLEDWSGWVRRLSGAEQVSISGETVTIETRFSRAMFDPASPANARGFDFVKYQVEQWYPQAQIEVDEFPSPSYVLPAQTWKNLILTIPGSVSPDEVVILSAHLDSTSANPYVSAPGADDNATGSAALIEAARILQGKSMPRTLRLIWFTGEEQGLVGSRAYTQDHNLGNVVGVINVDMVGYDGNNDRCIELHVGTLPASNTVGHCFTRSIEAYDLDLRYDYLTTTATNRSDHASFWPYGIGAVEVLENAFTNRQPNGCTDADSSPYYHTNNDTFANMHPAYAFEASRAALATAFSLASPVPMDTFYLPNLLRNE